MDGGDPFGERRALLQMSLIVTGISIVAAWLGAEITGVDLGRHLKLSSSTWLMGLLIGIPPVICFFALRQVRWAPIRQLFDIVTEILGPGVSKCSTAELAAISIGAGVSEELLFRGLLADWSTELGITAMLVVPNLVFGILHAVTPTYAVFAFGIGLYLSTTLYLIPKADLASLMVAHATYDLVCFLSLRHRSSNLPQQGE